MKIVDAKTCIQTALELSRNLQIDVSALRKWLDSVESELDQIDATPDCERDVDIEVAFMTVSYTLSLFSQFIFDIWIENLFFFHIVLGNGGS